MRGLMLTNVVTGQHACMMLRLLGRQRVPSQNRGRGHDAVPHSRSGLIQDSCGPFVCWHAAASCCQWISMPYADSYMCLQNDMALEYHPKSQAPMSRNSQGKGWFGKKKGQQPYTSNAAEIADRYRRPSAAPTAPMANIELPNAYYNRK